MSMRARLVLIETAGNQAYIFATNRLRENVGASELIHRVGMGFVLEALRELGTDGLDLAPAEGEDAATILLDPRRNPPIETGERRPRS